MTAAPLAALVAPLCAGAAAVLLVRPDTPSCTRLPREDSGPRPPLRRFLGVLLVSAAGLAVAVSEGRLPLRSVGLAVVTLAAVLAGLALWRRRGRRLAVELGQARVLDFCQLLAAELAAGQPPAAALERGAREWPALAPVVAALRLGSDLPAAFRRLSRTPGLGDLALAAAAWQVAHASGGGLAAAVGRVATGLRSTQATRRVVRAELASARATARLMAGLPVLALVMGRGMGGDPVAFLFATAPGLACLAGGLVLGGAGLWWIEAIADSVARDGW